MSVKLIVCLSVAGILAAVAAAEDLPEMSEATRQVVEECTSRENVTEEDVLKFAKKEAEATPQIKDFFLCITEKLGTFDGREWNREEIKRIVKDEKRMVQVEECLAKDDVASEPRERNFVVVWCCLEKQLALM